MSRFTSAIRFDRKHLSLLIALFLAVLVMGAKPKAKPVKEEPAAPGPELPKDLNLASLRVHAIDTIYELDLSADQLKMLRNAAAGAAGEQKRSAATGDEKLAAAFSDFNRALLTREDDQDIARLRNHLTELATSDEVHLDDEVEPTDTARTKAPEVCRKFSAGQIAAYLAFHADQIADPNEKMLALLTELHEDGGATDADTAIKDAGIDIGRLVAGQDDKKAAAIAAQVADWVKANHDLTDDQILAQHASLEASAKKVIGDVPPMDILSHWLENETAELLSNPQLPQAIEAVLAAQEQEH